MADRSKTLIETLERSPENHTLRLMVAEALAAEGRDEEALTYYKRLLQDGHLLEEALAPAGLIALESGDVDMALSCLEVARKLPEVKELGRLEAALEARRVKQVAALVERTDGEPSLLRSAEEETFRFEDVGGLGGVKRAIEKSIILPFTRPELYKKYGKRAGGGVLLYGPPGCGKTLLARATAGECGLPFYNVRIEHILDPYLGVSERNLHRAFEEARAAAPCVVFIDELDALAFTRRKQQGAGRALVDQLLQELDAIGADNDGLLVLAATNAPWDVDDALLRPGRFDRQVFIPPPDQAARGAYMRTPAAGPLLAEHPDRPCRKGHPALQRGGPARALREGDRARDRRGDRSRR